MQPRHLAWVLLPLLAAALAVAGTDEGGPPPYSVENLVPADDTAPEGWKVKEKDDGPGGLGLQALEALGREVGVDRDAYYVEFRVLESKDGACGVGLLDVEDKVTALRSALDAKAGAAGWCVAALGSPMRLLVVSGEEAQRNALRAALLEKTLYALCELARTRLNALADSPHTTEHARDVALEAVGDYAKAIRTIEPEAGVGYSLSAAIHINKGWKDPKKPDWSELDPAIADLRRALDPGSLFPPTGQHYVWAAGRLGALLLEKKVQSVLEDAVYVLEQAVAREAEAATGWPRVHNRYLLAVAMARQGRADDAFAALERAMAFAKDLLPTGSYKNFHEQVKEKDEDAAPLRQDPRFTKLMDDTKPPEPKKPAGHPK